MSHYHGMQGCCPKCGSINLEYSTIDDTNDLVVYPAKCHDCGFEYKEAYALTYVGFYDDKGNFVGASEEYEPEEQ